MGVAKLRDVARHAGVSTGTVSNSLNHPEKVSDETLRRVQDSIDELGFVRNDAARQLRAGTSQSVGMIVLDVRNPFFTDVAAGVEAALGPTDRTLVLGNSAQDAQREASYLNLFEEQRLSGLLITPAGDVIERLRRLRDRGMAIVLVDRFSHTRDFPSVSVDDRRGGYLAVAHLLATGRRRIAFVGGPMSIPQVKSRLAGARDAVTEAGCGVIVPFVTPAMDTAGGRAAAESLVALAPGDRPDAVFAANDLLALGVLQSLTLGGVAVPNDVAVVGYDDIDFAASSAIPLSSVRQPAHEMGVAAAEMLLELQEGRTPRPRHRRFRPELVVRRSSHAT